MSNKTHKRLAKTASRLLKSNGRAAHLITKSNSGTPRKPSLIDSSQDIIILPVMYEDSEIDGKVIMAKDRKFLMDSSIEPSEGDWIRDDDGVDHPIYRITKLRYSTVKILYKVQTRR